MSMGILVALLGMVTFAAVPALQARLIGVAEQHAPHAHGVAAGLNIAGFNSGTTRLCRLYAATTGISGRQKSLYVATRCEIRKMQKIDLGNNESLVCGVFPNQDGTFTAMTYTKSKTFKTETGARRWLEKHTVS